MSLDEVLTWIGPLTNISLEDSAAADDPISLALSGGRIQGKSTSAAALLQGSDDSQRLIRMKRNRESAAQSRQRKKEHVKSLEDTISRLTLEVEKLRHENRELLVQLQHNSNKQINSRI